MCISFFTYSQFEYEPISLNMMNTTKSIVLKDKQFTTSDINIHFEIQESKSNQNVVIAWVGCIGAVGLISLSHWSSPESSSEAAYYMTCSALVTFTTIFTISQSSKGNGKKKKRR